MSAKKSIILALLMAPLASVADLASDWENAPMGFVITNAVYDTYGVHIDFETDLEPPYIVGVYESWEDGLGRNFPIAEKVVDSKSAFVEGDFTDVTSFVEVMHPSRFTKGMPHRVLTKQERDKYRKDLSNRPIRLMAPEASLESADINWAPGNVMGQLKNAELIGDYLWTKIVYSNEKNFKFGTTAQKAVDNIVTGQVMRVVTETYWHFRNNPKQDWVRVMCETNYTYCAVDETEERSGSSVYGPYEAPCKYTKIKKVTTETPTGEVKEYVDGRKMVDVKSPVFSISATDEQVSRGVGWRILHHERTGEFLAHRAYSARTNCSNTVYLPRLFQGLSAHDGYRLTTDPNGVVICVPATNEQFIK